jgi:hypothetical protein
MWQGRERMEGMNQTGVPCTHYGNVTLKPHVKLLNNSKMEKRNGLNFKQNYDFIIFT